MSELTAEQWREFFQFVAMIFAIGACVGTVVGMKISERLYAKQLAAYERLLLAMDATDAD